MKLTVIGYACMTFLFIAAFGLCYLLSRRRAGERLQSAIRYSLSFDTDEVFRGEYLYLDQVIENVTDHRIPFLKIETLLPEGLSVVLVETDEDDATGKHRKRRDKTVHSTESLWTLAPHSRIRRRWRVLAERRGRYTAADVQVLVISNDPLGMGAFSVKPPLRAEGRHTLLVLPEAAEWLAGMAPAASLSGEGTVPHGLVHDPMTVAGVRPYDFYDPLNTIDWKQSAHVGSLMVRQTEAVENDAFNIVLNMQSALQEPEEGRLASPYDVEEAITVCASLLDSAVRRSIPVRLMTNTPPDTLRERGFSGGPLRDEDAVGSRIFCSEEFRGGESTMEAYRLLAGLPLVRTLPAEGLSDDIIASPEYYTRGGNVLFVTAYLDARMVEAYERLRERGVRMVFYVITTDHHAKRLPAMGDIFFKHGRWTGGSGYGY